MERDARRTGSYSFTKTELQAIFVGQGSNNSQQRLHNCLVGILDNVLWKILTCSPAQSSLRRDIETIVQLRKYQKKDSLELLLKHNPVYF